MQLNELGIIDIRRQLPRAKWSIGRRPATTSITVHYNGPPVAMARQSGVGLISQLTADAVWQMRPGWGGTHDGADGLQYHFVVDGLGTIYQARDIDAILWHCAHQDGNGRGLSVHLPLGGSQDATPRQWARVVALLDALRAAYHIPAQRVVGHLEWKHATACPGRLMPRVAQYRDDNPAVVAPTPTPPGLVRMRVLPELKASVNIRQGPGRSFAVAGSYKPGTIIYVDPPADASNAIDHIWHKGEPVNGDPRWAHLARVPHEQADLGFISATLLQPVV